MKQFYNLLLLLTFFTTNFTAKTNVSGAISSDTTWSLVNSPYVLTGNVLVSNGVTLTIEAGVNVNFTGDFNLLVKGNIISIGTNNASIVFNGNAVKGDNAMIIFKSANLSDSQITYNLYTGPQKAIQLADESEHNQDDIKNTGTLFITNSNFNKSDVSTKGYSTNAELKFENSTFDDLEIKGFYPRTEPISFTNCFISNSNVNSDSYNYGIRFIGSIVKNSNMTMGCCSANFLFDGSTVYNSNISNGGGSPVNGLFKVINSIFVSSVINLPSSHFISENSVFSSKNEVNDMISIGNMEVSNSSFIGYKFLNTIGIRVSGRAGYNIGGNTNITNSNLINFVEGLVFDGKNNINVTNNNIVLSLYNIKNNTDSNLVLENNYWGTSLESEIQAAIYDSSDDVSLGTVDYTPFLTTPNTSAPIAPPSNVVKNKNGTDVILTWSKNLESDTAGYKLYYGSPTGYSYESTIDLGNVTSYTVADADINSEFAITAYDTDKDGTDDMVEGNESWFSKANEVNVSLSASNLSVSEPTNTVNLIATLNNPSPEDIIVNLLNSGTAIKGTDYNSSLTITIPAGELTGVTELSAIDDASVEFIETIIVDIDTVIGAIEKETQQVTINLIDNDLPEVKTVVFDKIEFAEHEIVKVTATIDYPSSNNIQIPLDVSGTALIDTDYSTDFFAKGKASIYHGGNGLGNNNNQLKQPEGLALDTEGNLYIADYRNNRIQKKENSTGNVTNIIDGIQSPTDIHIDASGSIYVLIESGTVKKYDNSGSFISNVSTGIDNGAINMHVTTDGDIYTISRNSKKVWKSSINEVSASVFFEDTSFHFPNSIVLDSEGNVYVSGQNQRVRKWMKSTSTASNLETINDYQGSRAISINSKGNLLIAFDSSNLTARDAKVEEYTLNDGVATFYKEQYIQDSSSEDYYLGISALISKNNGDLFIAVGKDASQSGTNFSDENIKKDRILLVGNGPSINISAGETEGILIIKGIEDDLNFEGEEIDETITIDYQTPINASISVQISSTQLTLLNNEYSLEIQDNPFIGLSDSSVAWGDFDRDGDQDVAVIGRSNLFGIITKLYTNDDGSFVDTQYAFNNVYDGDIEWSDLNKDGFIDLIISGLDANNETSTKIYINTGGTGFNESSSLKLPNLFGTSISSGDLDNDGDIDFSINGLNADNEWVFEIYYRENDLLVREPNFNGTTLPFGSINISDYDFDGDQDILGVGNNVSFYKQNTNINNDNSSSSFSLPALSNSSFTAYGTTICMMGENSNNELEFWFGKRNQLSKVSNIEGLKNGDIALGDYNNDGILDIVVTGENSLGESISKLYDGVRDINDNGNSSVANVQLNTEINLKGFRNSNAKWVDYDLDGDLDLFLSGTSSDGEETILYKTSIANKTNNAPEKITDLTFENLGNGKVKLSWTAPEDDFSKEIGYIIRLGTTPGGSELSNTESNLVTGQRLITKSPAIYTTDYELSLAPGNYYWSVQSVDNGFQGSTFSEEQSFQLTYEWKVLNQGGIIDQTITAVSDPILKLSDLDNDNDLDLIYSSKASSGNLKTYSLDNNQYKLIQSLGTTSITDIVLLDLNNDNIQDIIVNNYESSGTNALIVYQSSENGLFSSAIISSGLYKGKLKVIDINNDGENEIAQVGLTSNFNNATLKINIFEQENNSLKNEPIDISSQIKSLTAGSFDFGDIDGDQDFDLAITGFSNSGLDNKIYLNETAYDESTITPILSETELKTTSARESTLDFIDFDSDGDLDIAITGTTIAGDIFKIYENKKVDDKVEFTSISTNLLPVRNANIELGDFDGDGYADILYSGTVSGQGEITKLASYNPTTKTFIDSTFDLGDIINASVAFGDIDGDGDLDFAISGEDRSDSSKNVFRTYLNVRNESAIAKESTTSLAKSTVNNFVKNDRPTAPENLRNYNVKYDSETQTYQTIFEWNPATDDHTPSPGLTYAIKIGTTDGGEEIMKVNSLDNGFRKLAGKGNVEHNLKWKLNLPNGSYYWSVQAIDASFFGSQFSETKEVNISTLKVNEEENNYLKIYPTLFDNYIEINNINKLPIEKISIYNMNGQKVISAFKNLDKSIFTIETNGLSNGIYILEVISQDKKHTTKLIKK
ncbi:FG-GAP-like repeat-containing protein [uncultured Polaribacter sp.]|uniref:FG-GAP-like repeat-containing protein n=1 Tax=uncultured Polaribacter sp. TaxID=174711 RepID=UPI00263837A1|nr:FG-GAP-like repeat-containing protein [uncultured Polaribacter sp.]